MAVAHARHSPRDDTTTFDPRMFYTLQLASTPTYTLNTRAFQGTSHAPEFMVQRTQASENWQLFYQSGYYFIRNFDFGPKWQLGFAESESSPQTPLLYPQSGGREQQWTLSKVDGGWEIANSLAGNGSRYALEGTGKVPSMLQTGNEKSDAIWSIVANPSAAQRNPLRNDSLSRVGDDVQSLSIAPSSTRVSATTGTRSVVASTPIDASGSATSTSSPVPPANLSTAAIAGISVGTIIFLLAVIFALWFFLRKKKEGADESHDTSHDVHDSNARWEKDGEVRIELAVPQPELSCRNGDPARYRVELDAKGFVG